MDEADQSPGIREVQGAKEEDAIERDGVDELPKEGVLMSARRTKGKRDQAKFSNYAKGFNMGFNRSKRTINQDISDYGQYVTLCSVTGAIPTAYRYWLARRDKGV